MPSMYKPVSDMGLKNDFPIFKKNKKFVYLDSAATSLKPQVVIDKITDYYQNYSANVFRGVYRISEKATYEFEETRKIVAKFINAQDVNEIIFTRNTTEALNLVAYSLGKKIVGKHDEVASTIMEHHSNFVPWQVLCFELGAVFKFIDIDKKGYLLEDLEKFISNKTKILALCHVSNVLGTINPLKQIIKKVKKINPNIIIVVDGAQSFSHIKIDVKDLDCDFFAFSSHKSLGPTGVGVLWGKKEKLEIMKPFLYGGEMIDEVTFEKSSFKRSPYKFEAGTPSIGEVIAFKEAIKYIDYIGVDKIREHEKTLVHRSINLLNNEFKNKITIFGPDNVEDRGGVIAFNFDKYHPHDIAAVLDTMDIAVRAGHHCAMPLHKRLEVTATVRASFYLYNSQRDLERLVNGLKKVERILK